MMGAVGCFDEVCVMALNDSAKNRLRHKIRVVMIVLAVVLLVLGFAVPITNNALAMGVARELSSLSLPPDTVIVEKTSMAGRMLNSHDSVQYIGAVLIKSDRSLDELKACISSQFEDSSQAPIVCRIQGQTLDIRDDVAMTFRESVGESGYYAVYLVRTGGYAAQWYLDLDTRG